MVGNRMEINDWNALKTALIQCFSDRRDLDCLIQELTRARPYRGENLIDFGSRLQLIRSNVFQRVSNDTTLGQDEKLCQITHYDKTALNTFIAGCSGTLKNNMHLRKPESLEDAIAYVNEFENFERLYGQISEPKTYPPRQTINPFPRNQNFAPRIPFAQQYQPRNFNRALQQNFPQKPFFPSQPINIQPRQMPPQKFPTASQVFGPQKNVFKPRPIPPNELPAPEPMSTTSRNPSMMSRRPVFGNQFQNRNFNNPQTNTRNFISEELFTNDMYNAGMFYGQTENTNSHEPEQNTNESETVNFPEQASEETQE